MPYIFYLLFDEEEEQSDNKGVVSTSPLYVCRPSLFLCFRELIIAQRVEASNFIHKIPVQFVPAPQFRSNDVVHQ